LRRADCDLRERNPQARGFVFSARKRVISGGREANSWKAAIQERKKMKKGVREKGDGSAIGNEWRFVFEWERRI